MALGDATVSSGPSASVQPVKEASKDMEVVVGFLDPETRQKTETTHVDIERDTILKVEEDAWKDVKISAYLVEEVKDGGTTCFNPESKWQLQKLHKQYYHYSTEQALRHLKPLTKPEQLQPFRKLWQEVVDACKTRTNKTLAKPHPKKGS